jgi:hypothetical protein
LESQLSSGLIKSNWRNFICLAAWRITGWCRCHAVDGRVPSKKLTSGIQATVLLLVLGFSAIEQGAPFQKETKIY